MIYNAVVEPGHPLVPVRAGVSRMPVHDDDDSLVFVLLVDVVFQNI